MASTSSTLYLDYTPKTWFNLQVGRIAVPFGEYANRVDRVRAQDRLRPAHLRHGAHGVRRASAMNLGVVPQPYVGHGRAGSTASAGSGR